jgi:ribosome-associated protein
MAKKEPSKKATQAGTKTTARKKTATAAKKTPAKKTASAPTSPAKASAKKVADKKTTTKGRVRPVKTTDDGMDISLILAQGMAERKATDIKILDLRGLPGASTDFFVISHAASDKQVEAIADSAEEELFKTTGERPWHREGYQNLEWVLLDYINVVVHVFREDKRGFYAVEELWGDAKDVVFKPR